MSGVFCWKFWWWDSKFVEEEAGKEGLRGNFKNTPSLTRFKGELKKLELSNIYKGSSEEKNGYRDWRLFDAVRSRGYNYFHGISGDKQYK